MAVVAALSAVVCCAGAQSLRSQIETSNKTVHKLMMAKDAAGFKKYMKGWAAPGFKYVEQGRTENFDTMCAGMAMGMSQMKKIVRADSKILSLHENGNKATTTMMHVMVGTTMPGPDHKTHTMTYMGTSEDTYVKKGGSWKMSKMAWIKETMLMDGKPAPERAGQ